MQHKIEVIEQELYTFGDLVMIGRKVRNVYKTTWYVKCQGCEETLLVQRVSQKMWVARCYHCKLEYTITPAEYYIMKHADFKRIMGEI